MNPQYVITIFLTLLVVLVFAVLLGNLLIGPRCGLYMCEVRVVSGEHTGRHGKVVNIPCVFNLWNLFAVTINVAANEQEILRDYYAGWGERVGELIQNAKEGHGPRTRVRVPKCNIEVIAYCGGDYS